MDVEILKDPVIAIPGLRKLEPPFGMNFRDWFNYKRDLESKKSVVRSQVKRIAKNGENKQQGYRYAEAADIYDQINDIMHEARLGYSCEYLRDEVVLAKNGAPINKVYLLVTWTDLDTGYFEQQEFAGFGLDYGDKGIYKAYTGAAKYSLVINFLIPTGDDPARGAMDPENDRNATPETQQGAQNGQHGGSNDRWQGNGSRSQGNGSSGQNGGRGGQGNKQQEPPPLQEPPADKKQKTEGTPQGTQGPQEKPDNKQDETHAGEQQEPVDRQQHTGEGGEVIPLPVTSDQVGKIKAKVLTLAAFSDDKNKRAAQDAVYGSMTIKPELKAWGERVKAFKTNEERVVALTMDEATKAIEYLDGWIAMKEKAKKNKSALEEAVKEAAEVREEVAAEQAAQEEKTNA